MTDLPTHLNAVPSRLGSSALVDERGLVVEIDDVQAEMLHHGVLRLSVLSFLVDVSAGVTLDTDPDSWTFTTDLSLRMQVALAPSRVTTSTTILRQGRRSAHGLVEVVDDQRRLMAAGAIGFAHVPRKPHDPPKPLVSPEMVAKRFTGSGACPILSATKPVSSRSTGPKAWWRLRFGPRCATPPARCRVRWSPSWPSPPPKI